MYASNVRLPGKNLSDGKVQGQTNENFVKLTFFVSGKLWGRSLVMEDKETGSQWSHILGKAMAGKLKGTQLEIIPSEMTNWGTWQSRYPKTTVTMIRRTAQDFETEMLQDAKRFGFGFVHGGKARLWGYDQLKLEPLVNDEHEDLPLVVYFDVPSRTPYAWRRSILPQRGTDSDSVRKTRKTLSFRMTAQGVQDTETGSVWDLRAGRSTDGTLKDTRLEAVPAIVTFTHSWQRFHPDSTEWLPESTK